MPQEPTEHNCINLRLPTYGGLYVWEFEKRGRALNVCVEGRLVFNSSALRLNAALDGLGLAYMPEEQAGPYIAEKRLTRVLADWCPLLGMPPPLSEPPATDDSLRFACGSASLKTKVNVRLWRIPEVLSAPRRLPKINTKRTLSADERRAQ